MDVRKRKRLLRTPIPFAQYFSTRYLLLCFFCFLCLIFISRGFNFGSGPFQPAPIVPKLAMFSSSASKSVQDLSTHHKVDIETSILKSNNTSSNVNDNNDINIDDGDLEGEGEGEEADKFLRGLSIESRILFNDHILIVLLGNREFQHMLLGEKIDCVYQKKYSKKTVTHPMLAADEYGIGRWMVRCPTPPKNCSAAVWLQGRQDTRKEIEWEVGKGENQTVQSWDMLAYEAVFDGSDVAVVFVKGLQLKSDRESDPNLFKCVFKREGDDKVITTKAITAAQEVIRCPLPPELKAKSWNENEVQITVEMFSKVPGTGRSHLKGIKSQLAPSIAKLYKSNNKNNEKVGPTHKYNLCACTMVWNQAAFIKEWVMYHAWLGVERWFVYDNNSDDGLKDVINELNDENYNVTRHVWPWIKSQEAGFSHCVLRTRDQCKWIAFFDVDEFFFFPPPKPRLNSSIVIPPGPNALQTLVKTVSSRSRSVGDIRTDCHNFGPSGLKKSPAEGLMLGYTCRLKSLERHKSIVRPEAVDDSLLNQVHHFKLKKEFRKFNFRRAVINHYKFQVWDVFKAKFHRRVSTYVADWQENQNERSRDRVPGLGTEAIEPSNWRRRFCEVWDTRLRDFVLANLADHNTGLLPWQRSAKS
ncbi:glycosyltransferase family 92 protein At1g27200-like [Amaranthus tricolor]|uniref:glycosyltransferase family 92 protein At1g27200-like n=1 Tax=Amaranthus tricolor TaxID=29722 RepID=UPI00258E445C|nr:glycosyltransferase family 92 protein At1g27200-like [Amaranthus tricolor]